jgi:GntR family transcriptional regulator, transcriptional repressor for pyruvate dehydrogenase complex
MYWGREQAGEMSVTTEAIEKVEEMILSGEPQPDAKLPRENELAERLGVSRSSLRGAVRALAALNVIETRQGDRTHVTSLTPERG